MCALKVIVAGGHYVFRLSPPGSGKIMLAKRRPAILLDLILAEVLETSKIYRVMVIDSWCA
jgi:predicted ATPase with chaperone activity